MDGGGGGCCAAAPAPHCPWVSAQSRRGLGAPPGGALPTAPDILERPNIALRCAPALLLWWGGVGGGRHAVTAASLPAAQLLSRGHCCLAGLCCQK